MRQMTTSWLVARTSLYAVLAKEICLPWSRTELKRRKWSGWAAQKVLTKKRHLTGVRHRETDWEETDTDVDNHAVCWVGVCSSIDPELCSARPPRGRRTDERQRELALVHPNWTEFSLRLPLSDPPGPRHCAFARRRAATRQSTRESHGGESESRHR